MRKFFLALICFLLAVSALAGPVPAAQPLRVALVPIANPDRFIDGVKPAMRFLEKQIGRKIRYFITLNYSAAVEAMSAGRADISFLPPLPYVLARSQAGVEVILGEIYRGKNYYHSKIFVRRDSGIKNLSDLKDKTIAYVDPISSSGFMYPHDIFERAKLLKGGIQNPEGDFFRRVYFAGGDEQAIRSVLGKFVDAAGVSEFSINLLKQNERAALLPLASSARIPSHNVVARKGLDPKLKERFIAAMLKLNKPDNQKYLKYLYGTEGYIKVSHSAYQLVADMALKYGFIRK
jgi:phosphonate transport system substrate-binding protein